MAVDDAGLRHDAQVLGMHGGVLGGKAGDQVGTYRHVGAMLPQGFDQGQRLGTAVAALHPLEHQVCARLQREMHVRHHARLVAQEVEQQRIDFHPVDRR